MRRQLIPSTPQKQKGISLIESLIAMVVLAVGVMGLAGVQMRTMAEARTANSRAIAVGLIDDLANRMFLNRSGVQTIPNSYTLAWGAPTPAQNCNSAVCTPAQLAASDLNLWKQRVVALLPGADTAVFNSPLDPRQIGIAIAWNANESQARNADAATYDAPFTVTVADSGVACPPLRICHVVYVNL